MKPLTFRNCLIKARKYTRIAANIPAPLQEREGYLTKAQYYKSLALEKATTKAEKDKANSL